MDERKSKSSFVTVKEYVSTLLRTLTRKRTYPMLSGVQHVYRIGPQNRASQPDDRSQPEVCLIQLSQPVGTVSAARSIKSRTSRALMTKNLLFASFARTIGLLLFVATLAVAIACQKQTCEPPPKEDAQYVLSTPSNAAPVVDVFLDSTLSMKGFVSAGSNSYFQQTLPILESAVISRWTGGETHFYKFGTQIEALASRSYLEAAKPQFYLDSDYNTLTLIEDVIDSAKLDHLTVIVTDLFQNNSDINQLSDKIKKKYISQGLAVGIGGIKSEFDGEVYDVGPDKYSFHYPSGTDPKRFRPFYLLVLGSHGDVAKYFEALTYGGLNKYPSELKQRVIFSPFIASPLANFEGAKIINANKIARQDSGTLVRAVTKDARIEEFKIVGSPDVAEFNMELNYHPLTDIVLTSQELDAEVTAWNCGEKSNANAQAMQESAEARNSFKIKTAKLSDDNQKIQLGAQIDPKTLPGDGIYSFRVVLRPRDYLLPEWIGDWNMRAELIDGWHRNPAEFDGSKTYNLENFLRTLWGAALDAHHPKSAILYCYIKRGSS